MARITALVLAAGMSKRMGQPKMLLPWAHTTVLGQVVDIIAQTGIEDIIVVTGGDRQVIEAEVLRLSGELPVRSFYNEKFKAGGMMSSIQAGLIAVPSNSDAVLIALGDQPQIELKTIINVISCFTETNADIVVPSYNNHRGHPILFNIRLLPIFKGFSETQSLREFLNQESYRIKYVDANESILKDLDTPDDYKLSSKGKK